MTAHQSDPAVDIDQLDYVDPVEPVPKAAPQYAPMDCRCGGVHCLPTYRMFEDDNSGDPA